MLKDMQDLIPPTVEYKSEYKDVKMIPGMPGSLDNSSSQQLPTQPKSESVDPDSKSAFLDINPVSVGAGQLNMSSTQSLSHNSFAPYPSNYLNSYHSQMEGSYPGHPGQGGSGFGYPFGMNTGSGLSPYAGYNPASRMGGYGADPYQNSVTSLMNQKSMDRDGDEIVTNSKGKKKIRKPRTIYSSLQLQQLNKIFQRTQYLSLPERAELASSLGLTQTQVKIWFQNKRSKFKKILKHHQGGPNAQTPGNTSMGGMSSPDPNSPEPMSPEDHTNSHTPGPQLNGHSEGLESPPPPQAHQTGGQLGNGGLMSSPDGNPSLTHPQHQQPHNTNSLGSLHHSMSPVLPVSSTHSWGGGPDLSNTQGGQNHYSAIASHNMYSSQAYMAPQSLPQHYGWGGYPQNTMGAQPPLLT